MKNLKTKLEATRKSDGFTIIEVMIVLAVAGAIMLIVLLAVPQLQRNSRNTARKADVNNLLSAVNTYVANNNGAFAAAAGVQFDSVFKDAPKMGYYTTASNITWTAVTSAYASAPGDPNNLDQVKVYNYLTCNGTAASITGASSRSVIALFDIETPAGSSPQCIQS